jgi:hypothetical protein
MAGEKVGGSSYRGEKGANREPGSIKRAKKKSYSSYYPKNAMVVVPNPNAYTARKECPSTKAED